MTFLPPLVLSIACVVLVNESEAEANSFRVSRSAQGFELCNRAYWLSLISLKTLAAALVNTSVLFSLLATCWSTIRGGDLQDEPLNSDNALPLIHQLYQSTHEASSHAPADIPMILFSEAGESRRNLVDEEDSTQAVTSTSTTATIPCPDFESYIHAV